MKTTSGRNNHSWNSAFVVAVGLLTVFALALRAQETATVSTTSDSIVQMTAEADGLNLVSEVPTSGTFWIVSAEGITAPMPFLPPADQGLPTFAITNNVFLVDASAGEVDLQWLGATTTAEALEIMASQVENVITLTRNPPPATAGQSMSAMSGGIEPMFSLISGSSGAPYLTNMTAVPSSDGSSMISSFSIAGGTNGFAYDIYSTTNLASTPVYSQWTWLGQGYTSNSYTFSNQPVDQAFYILAIPRQTMVVAWSDDSSGQCDAPADLTNAIDVAGGYDFSLALKTDGTVAAWGYGANGETNVPAGLTNVTAIAAGGAHALALLQNGTVTAWGADGHGQTNVPAGLSNVTAIAAGYQFSMALRNDGTVVAWGDNTYGETNVPALGAVKQIAAGFYHSAALLSNGTVKVWGYNGGGYGWNITNVPAGLSNVVSISAGGFHTLALKADGTVAAWGAGTTDSGYEDFGQSIVPSGLSNVVAISGGGYHSVALQANGTVVTWGDDTYGQLDLPDEMTGVKAISAGGFHTLAIRSGQLTPVILQEPTDQYGVPGGSVTFSVQSVGFDGVQYQWLFNGMDIEGATNATLTLTNLQTTNAGIYQVIISDVAGSISSQPVTLYWPQPPVILGQTPAPYITLLYGSNVTMSVQATNTVGSYKIGYQWSLNGVALSGSTSYTIAQAADANEGTYSVTVTNAGGSTNASWTVYVAGEGSPIWWGNTTTQAWDFVPGVHDVIALAGGGNHALALHENGTVLAWGTNDYGQTNVPVGLSNVVAVAAGEAHSLALRADGSVVAWGRNDLDQTNVPANVTNVIAISADGQQSLALLQNGTVVQWGQTNAPIPGTLTNVTAIACGTNFDLALLSNTTVVAWGANNYGQTNVPANLTNVVAIAAGGAHALALLGNGTIAAWGDNTDGETNVPGSLTNVIAIAAGYGHSVVLRNDGTVVAWGNDAYGQTNVPAVSHVKLIAAGGYQTLACIFSPLTQYPVNVSQDLLLIYNTNSTDSVTVLNYYLAHRPMVSGANVLGIGWPGIFVTNGGGGGVVSITNTTVYETISYSGFTNQILAPVQIWLSNNPTKHPQYVVLFLDVPSRVDNSATNAANYPFNYPQNTHLPSVSYQLAMTIHGWSPFITHINMGGTNDCIAYINKLVEMDTNNSLVIGASGGGYGNTNYYFDDVEHPNTFGLAALDGVTNNGASLSQVTYVDGSQHITNGTNVAGFVSWGVHGYNETNADYATNGSIVFNGNSTWWIIQTVESFNGQRYRTSQGTFVKWFSSNAFGGTNYSNTPVGAVSHTDEPTTAGVNDSAIYFGLWQAEDNFAICAWNSRLTPQFQAIGDPFVIK